MLTRLIYEVPIPPTSGPFVGLMRGFAAVAGAATLWGMHAGRKTWFQALVRTFSRTSPANNIILRTSMVPGRLMVRAAASMFHFFSGTLSHGVALQQRPLQQWMVGWREMWHAHTQTVAHVAESASYSIEGMKHRVIPREIHKAVHPVATTAEKAYADARRSISLERKDRRDIGRGIDRLKRRGRWPLAAGLLGIDAGLKVLRDHERADHKDLHRVTHHDIPALRHGVETLNKTKVGKNSRTWKKVAELVTAAGFAAALTRALARKWPWTRCNNFNRLSKMLRCSHFGFLADVLAYGLALLVVVDPVVIAKAAILSEEAMDTIVKRIAELNPEP